MKREWPYNLLAAVLGWEDDIVEFDEPEDLMLSVSYVLSDIKKPYSDILIERFKYGKTYSAMAKENNVTAERIRQKVQRGLRMIRRQDYKIILSKGIHFYVDSLKKDIIHFNYYAEKDSTDNMSNDIPIECFGLSARARNALKRARFRDIEDIRKAFEDFSIIKVRGMGRHSIAELADTIHIDGFSIDAYLDEYKNLNIK